MTATIFDPRLTDEFQARTGFNLLEHMIMACYVGSESHGTYMPGLKSIDDVDIFAVVVPPTESIIGLTEWEHCSFIKEELDVNVFSLRKWVRLLLKNNPNMLGTLWLRPENYMYRSQTFEPYVANRNLFSSMTAYHSFSGYAHAQLAKLQRNKFEGYMGSERKALVDKFGYDPKMASHLIRLYRMGIEFVQTGELNVYRPDREELMAIKRGEWTLERVHALAATLKTQMLAAYQTTVVPAQPDFKAVEQLVMDTHRFYLHQRRQIRLDV